MEGQKKDFIKGGLPLSTADFVDKKKSQENKNKLLVALDNINKVHTDKMAVANEVVTTAQNYDAVGITLDMLDKDSAEQIKNPVEKTEYVFSDQIIKNDEPLFTNNEETPSFENSGFEAQLNEQPVFEAPQSEAINEPIDLNNLQQGDFNQGEPMIVLDDAEVGKKSKSSKKRKQPTASSDDIKSGRGIAWMAYILFFIPLIFKKNNLFVRHHANEGLEVNIIDVIGLVLYFLQKFVKVSNTIASIALMVAHIVGFILILITTVTKLYLIIFSFAGKEAQSPFFGKKKFIK